MHIHFMGAGGSGVSGLMLIARSLGHLVSGCDRQRSGYLDMLERQGIPVTIGHDQSHLAEVDLLVCSSAVSDGHMEVMAARMKGIPVVRRGDLLAKILEGRRVIGIAGAHGKTSTAWLTGRLLRRFVVPASLYSGGRSQGTSSVVAGDPWVVELDESDGSIFSVRPQTLVITNLELEHAEYYGTEQEMLRRFRSHLALIGHRRFVIGRGYPVSDRLFEEFGGLTFPTRAEIAAKREVRGGRDCRFLCDGGNWTLDFHGTPSDLGTAREPAYVIQNRAAALLAAYSHLRDIGRRPEPVPLEFWDTVPPVERRFERKGSFRGLALIDDYAHHPSEVQALMDRAGVEFGRYLMVFQPHRHTRFDRFINEFAKVLESAPALLLLPVYGAGEPRGAKESRELYDLLKKSGMRSVHYADTLGEAAVTISAHNFDWVRAIITVGAGDVNDIFGMLEE